VVAMNMFVKTSLKKNWRRQE